MTTLDITGYWSSLDLYQGTPEEDALALAADGTGWYDWSSMGGGFEVLRFRWDIAETGELTLRMAMYLQGTWSKGSQPGKPFYHIAEQRPMDQTRRTNYTIGPALNALRRPVTVLALADRVVTGQRFALVRTRVDAEDYPIFKPDPQSCSITSPTCRFSATTGCG
jgi:hypothetical protein